MKKEMRFTKILIIFSVVLCLCAGCAKSENTSNTYLADAEIDSHVHVVNDESYKLLTPTATPSPVPTTALADTIDDSMIGTADADGYIISKDKVTVSATTINLRETPSIEGNIVTGAKKGDVFTRIAKGPDGWDKIEYNGMIVYAYSQYLTDTE
jgi:uncharacterized protein YgiM (DUF1202 family)